MHALKICLLSISIALLSILLLLVVINAVFHIVYFDFYKDAERSFKIPGLNAGFVPQGIEDSEAGILISGYMKSGEASRIYVCDGKESACTEIFNGDGSPYKGHAGGIDVHGDRVFLTGDMTTEVLSLKDITVGDGKATVRGSFDPGLDPAWCTVWGEYILMGSFANSASDDYPPEDSEKITTPCGDKNVALTLAFKLDESFPLGINPTPEFAISIGEKVQGLSIMDEKTLVLSTSYGLGSSKLIFHSIEKMKESAGTYTITEGGHIPLYYLDSASEVRTVKAPPMSEELMIKDGYIYIMNESACNKYIFGKFLGQYRAYRYKI